ELCTCIEMTAEFRLLVVEAATHFRILRALAREHEDNGRSLVTLMSGAYPSGGKGRRSLVALLAEHHRAMRKGVAPNLQGMGDIGHLLLRMPADMVRQIVPGL